MVSSPAGGTDEQARGPASLLHQARKPKRQLGAAIIIPSTMMLKMMYGVAAR